VNKSTLQQIFQRFQAQNPHPKTELHYQSHFELLVAVILSAQATDISVNKATQHLFPMANTPEAILALGEERLKNYIKTIGLFNSKARHIIQTCERLVAIHHSKVPKTRAELEALPGVGRKTANVILNTLFGQPTIAVDTHIFRVANRTGLARGKTPLAVERHLEKNIDPQYLLDAHHWLVLHGRYVCVAKKPHCPSCIIQDLCEYPQKTK
jgi:endonuclease-3